MRRIAVITVSAVIAALLVLYAVATGMFANPDPPAWLTERPIAHRGQWTDGPEAPENSLAAFEKAAGNGYAVELDVHRTKDGHTVVVHDDELTSMTGEPGIVAEMTLAEIRQRTLLGGDQRVPTLEEALDIIGGRVPVFVEVKNDGDVGALEDDVASRALKYRGPIAVMSFNPFSVARVAAGAPEVPMGQLSGSFDGEDLEWYEVFLLRRWLMNWKSAPDFVAYELDELPAAGAALQRWRGRPLLVWTAENPEELQAAEGLGDAVIADPRALPQQ